MLRPHDPTAGAAGRLIKEGDLVIVYENHASMKGAVVAAKGNFRNRYGEWLHQDWIGKPFGSKVYSKGGSWVHVLAPNPELWTQVLQHRTQILYIADISLICMGLELRPGCTVLETGTGSGSLTHSLARAVAPTGHVHTFEFHQVRCGEAQKEFAKNGLSDIVTCMHRDIEGTGFPEALHGQADGIILDLPGPWKVVESAAKCLKPNGHFCGFSPCIEQVQKTAAQLRNSGFTDVRCVECLLRFYEVRRETFAAPSLATSSDIEVERAAKRSRQEAAQSEGAAGDDSSDVPTSKKRSRDDASSERATPTETPSVADRSMLCAVPQMAARGHTGYLLFARKLVSSAVLQALIGQANVGA